MRKNLKIAFATALVLLALAWGTVGQFSDYLVGNRTIFSEPPPCDDKTRCKELRNLFVVDAHSDTLMHRSPFRNSNAGHLDAARLAEGGVDLQILAVASAAPAIQQRREGPCGDIGAGDRLRKYFFLKEPLSPSTWFSAMARVDLMIKRFEGGIGEISDGRNDFPDDPNYRFSLGRPTPTYIVHTTRGMVKRYVHKNHPDAARALAEYGLNIATLANNHAMDMGPAGLSSTLSTLTDVGITGIGAGLTDADAAAPYIAESPFGRVGIFSFGESGGTAPDVTPQSAGIRVLNTANADAAAAMAREQKIDWLVAVVHWGNNYAPVLPTQQKWAQRLAKRGFHLVVGHGPHVLQPVSLVATKRRGILGRMTHHMPVLYSLGNFSFQFPGRFTPEFPGYGVVATAVLGPSGFREIQLTCIQTDNRIVNYQIKPCSDHDAKRVLGDVWPGIKVVGATGTVRL